MVSTGRLDLRYDIFDFDKYINIICYLRNYHRSLEGADASYNENGRQHIAIFRLVILLFL